jgi:3-deoxy-D-manno-octulosonate 8-phosphate phosphatase (KDO 8-P phosphatase)
MAARRRKLDAALAARLEMLVLDVDGVLTDGSLYFGASGEMLKAFNVRDGNGIKLLQRTGMQVAVISGRRSAAVARRCRELGIRHVVQGADNKSVALDAILERAGVGDARLCACIGDDTPDIPLFARVGLAFAVADAHPLARAAATMVTTLPGGRGAVREVCDLLMTARAAAAARRERGGR